MGPSPSNPRKFTKRGSVCQALEGQDSGTFQIRISEASLVLATSIQAIHGPFHRKGGLRERLQVKYAVPSAVFATAKTTVYPS